MLADDRRRHLLHVRQQNPAARDVSDCEAALRARAEYLDPHQRVGRGDDILAAIAHHGIGISRLGEGIGSGWGCDETYVRELFLQHRNQPPGIPDDELLRWFPTLEVAARNGALPEPRFLDQAVDRNVGAGRSSGRRRGEHRPNDKKDS